MFLRALSSPGRRVDSHWETSKCFQYDFSLFTSKKFGTSFYLILKCLLEEIVVGILNTKERHHVVKIVKLGVDEIGNKRSVRS